MAAGNHKSEIERLLQFQPADLLELKRKEAEVAAMLQIEEEVLKEHDELSDRSTKLVAQQSTAVARVAVIARTFYELRERIDEDVLELVLEWKREKMREK
ncbi:uncharacterized protein JCM6883_000269 [Sporobolomyces salmoneus]|uniref:uncharacterized protein n=1 Tax=Sporobolomyces salmoneus TaxID=183962 RepID=UPI003181FAA2